MDPATFWTAVGALGTCVAAAATVMTLFLTRKPIRFIQLQGRWKGDLGDEWDFQADLHVQGTRIEGKIRWKLTECPGSLPWAAKVGASGFELVEGTKEKGILIFWGQKVLGPDPDLVGLSDYTIPLPVRGNTFEGRSEPQAKKAKYAEGGTLRGSIKVFKKAPVFAN